MREHPGPGRTLYELYREAYTPWEWHSPLKQVATGLGLDLFSTPFDPTAVEFLERLGVPAHKVASFELVDLSLIEAVVRNRQTADSDSREWRRLDEIAEAVEETRRARLRDRAFEVHNVFPPLPRI